MANFYIEKEWETNPQIKQEVWEMAIKYWLAVEKGNFNPSSQEITKYSNHLESNQSSADIQSFCNCTGWKYKN